MARRGVGAKPRSGVHPLDRTSKPTWRNRVRKRLKSAKLSDAGAQYGELVMGDARPTGQASGVVFGVTGPKGGMAGNPAVNFAYRLRRLLKPIRVAPAEVRDGSGALIAHIVVDPVTGERSRVPV